jgi:hypothetical protein
MGSLVQLKLVGGSGAARVERIVVVPDTVPLLGLHAILQLALKPKSPFEDILKRVGRV